MVAHVDEESLAFSPDGKTLYFITSAWVTSGAMHRVNVSGSNHRFVVPANSLKVIQSGPYRSSLLISQHRYFMFGGSYDWCYLYSAQGKEIGVLGESSDLPEIYLGAIDREEAAS